MTEYVFHTLEANLQHQYSFKEFRRKHELTKLLGLRMDATNKIYLWKQRDQTTKGFKNGGRRSHSNRGSCSGNSILKLFVLDLVQFEVSDALFRKGDEIFSTAGFASFVVDQGDNAIVNLADLDRPVGEALHLVEIDLLDLNSPGSVHGGD